jgi:hypothetical protein
MLENWTDDLIHPKIIDYYYENIKDWYTPKNSSSIFPFRKQETFYLLEEPYEYND